MLCVHSKSGSTTLKRPLQCLYPLEVHHEPDERDADVQEDSNPKLNLVQNAMQWPKRAAAERARIRVSEWSEELARDDTDED